jgi:hypothetical protein
MVDAFIDMQVKGKTKKEERTDILGHNVEYGKMLDFGLKYTSMLRIGFGLANAVTNDWMGSVSNWIEAAGGRYYTLKDYNAGTNVFWTSVSRPDSKMWAVVKQLNPMMEIT